MSHRLTFTAGLSLFVLGLSACAPNTLPARPPNPTGAPTEQPVTLARYSCDSGARITARYPDNERALLRYHGETHQMTLARSASGARYVGDDLAWWTKGTGPYAEATLFRQTGDDDAGEIIQKCHQTLTADDNAE